MRHAPGPAVSPAACCPSSGRRLPPVATATAVAATVAATVAAFASPAGAQEMVNQLEASVRLGFELETEPDSSVAFEDFGSRIRWNGEKRISDTLVGLGYLEFGFDDEFGIGNTRYAYVGVSGGFGAITGGKQYRAFYDVVTSNVDVAYVGSCEFDLSCARQSGVIKYERALGQNLRIVGSTTLIDNDAGDDFLDEIDLGAIAEVSDITVGAALTIGTGVDADQPDDVDVIEGGFGDGVDQDTGVAIGVAAATELREDLTVSASLQFASDDYLAGPDNGFVLTGAAVAERFYGVVSLADADDTPFYATVGYEYPIDDDSLIYAEVQGVETDVDGEDFGLFLRAVYVYNFGAVQMISRDR